MADISAIETASGAALLVEKISGVNSVALNWLVPFGHAHDPVDRLGRASVLSEMLMRGDEQRDSREQADAFDRIGASRGIDPGKRYMRFSTTVLSDRFADAAALIADNVLRPRLGQAALSPAQDLAQQSLESLQDDPQQLAVIGARARHHQEPLNRSGYGTAEGIAALTADDAGAHWLAAAKPVSSIVSVAGNVTAEQAEAVFAPLFAGWQGEATGFELGGEPPRGYAHHDDAEANQVQIVVVHDGPKESDDESVLERFVASVLSGGMSGRLFTEVREKRGLCYSVSASFAAEKDRGTTTAYVGTTPERAQESIDVLTQELVRITTEAGAITPDEFERAKVGMKSRLVFSGESSGARAAALASDWHRIGRTRTLEEMAQRIDAVTLDAVNAYARTRTLGRVTVQTLGPKALTVPADLK
ncbi:MAG: pitrilysin family protein [Planctomycetota bacterium]